MGALNTYILYFAILAIINNAHINIFVQVSLRV